MRFPVYLFVLVSALLLSVVFGYMRDFVTGGPQSLTEDPKAIAPYQERALRLAALFQQTIAEWQVYGGNEEIIYLVGKDARGEERFTAVFHRETGDLLGIEFLIEDETPREDLVSRSPRRMADFWLRRLGENNENPYRWAGDGSRGITRCFSYWRSPTHQICVSLHPRTGQLCAIRFRPLL